MLCKYIKGRLGNQMFQYASMRAFQQKYFKDSKIVFSFKDVEKYYKKGRYNQIDSLCDFNCVYETNKTIHLNIKQKILIFLISSILFFYKYIIRINYDNNRNRVEKRFKKVLLKNNIIWKTIGYEEFDINLLDKNKDIIFYGYLEAIDYFKDYHDIISQDFTPKNDVLLSNVKMLDTIKKSNSVCVSIRRGDFVTRKRQMAEHFICDDNYFNKAISIINEKIDNPQYVVFSDDIEWVKNNMKFPDNTLYESGTDPVWEKLRLMSACKHFIISNSSFSWWAQFLSLNNNKVVIAPSRWNLKNDNRDLYDKDWILI